MQDYTGTKYYLAEEAFAIQYMSRKGHMVMPRPHEHPFYEIYYLHEGERIYFMNGQVFTAQRGDMVLINPNELHSTASPETSPGFERMLLHFHHSFVPGSDIPLVPFEKGSHIIRFPLKEQPEVERILKEMLAECSEPRPGTSTCVQALLAKLLVHVYRQGLSDESIAPRHVHPMHQKMTEITSYLNRHYQSELTLEQVAKLFYISPSYLSRLFTKLTGFHFREYLQVVRIREAQKQITSSKLKIQQIAENVGFEHIAHFNKTFKKITGVSPLRYRKQQQEAAVQTHEREVSSKFLSQK